MNLFVIFHERVYMVFFNIFIAKIINDNKLSTCWVKPNQPDRLFWQIYLFMIIFCAVKWNEFSVNIFLKFVLFSIIVLHIKSEPYFFYSLLQSFSS